MKYTFSQDEARAAYEAWGCNCGPTALAFALQTTLDVVRPAIPDFESRRYTSPTMMSAAIEALGRRFGIKLRKLRVPLLIDMFCEEVALVRIQWTGPWTQPLPQRWAAKYTHWVCTWRQAPADCGANDRVFDVNSGIDTGDHWRGTIPRTITDTIPGADGGWYVANVWRLEPEAAA